jgi:uncharacterized membrane protein
MPHWLFDAGICVNRWLHIVAAGLLVGGVLFFNFVLPAATAELKDEQRLAVFGRARWMFRSVVWFSVIALVVSGSLSWFRVWPMYRAEQTTSGSAWLTSLPWTIGHMAIALIAFAMLFRITAGRRLLERPVGWLGASLIVLLVGIFLASVARHWELHLGHWGNAPAGARGRNLVPPQVTAETQPGDDPVAD